MPMVFSIHSETPSNSHTLAFKGQDTHIITLIQQNTAVTATYNTQNMARHSTRVKVK